MCVTRKIWKMHLRMAARSDTLDEAKIRAAAKPFDSVAVAEHAVQIYREALENTK